MDTRNKIRYNLVLADTRGTKGFMNTGDCEKDDFPHIHLGDYVQLHTDYYCEEFDFWMYRGDTGTVVGKGDYSFPTVQWEATADHRNEVCDVDPECFEVLCQAGFASDEETTPKKKRTTYVRRSGS